MAEKTRAQYAQEIARLKASLPAVRTQLQGIPGVIDVFVGIKETGGMATDEVVFQVYVENKKPLDHVAPEHRIPRTIAGAATDVISAEGIEPQQVICGGIGMTQSTWGLSGGTLGACGLANAANTHVAEGTPVFLTNHHVAETIGDVVGFGCLCDSWCCECCEFGRVIDAQQTDRVDASIGTLNEGVRFTHEILGIGAIRSTDIAITGTNIVKYGITTGLTKGRVTNDNFGPFTRGDKVTMRGQIRIAPVAPFKRMSAPGDSGSIYVDADTRCVVGLHHSGDGTNANGSHIGDVMGLLHFSFPVMGTAGAIPLDGLALDPEQPTMLTALAQYRRELELTESGRLWLELVRAHAAEVRHLVNHQRETQVAWHRSQGPSFIAHYTRNARDPAHRVPREIGGVRLENLIISMATVLQRHGSPELARAITDHYLTTLQFAQSADSVRSVLAGARRIAGA
jgi:hypothetical protein